MDYNRVFQILTMELTSDILKSEDELERLMNSNIDINEKISKIKEQLSKINTLEHNLNKLTNMLKRDENNNNNNNN
jgi:hypothetical protein